MNDHEKTNKQLFTELAAAQERIALLEEREGEWKSVEIALRESEERFKSLSEASSEGVAINDKGNVVDANQTFATMFG